jgi:hypothetical protein
MRSRFKQVEGALVGQKAQWIKTHKDLKDNHQDNLLICVSLTLENFLHVVCVPFYPSREAYSNFRIAGMHSVALTSCLSALLPISRHCCARILPRKLTPKSSMVSLACSSTSPMPHPRIQLSARPVSSSTSNAFQPTADLAEMVQVNVMGDIKHLRGGRR